MALKSSFSSDLAKEQRLAALLDSYYTKSLKHYTFKRIASLKEQLAGIDVIFTHKHNGKNYGIDEKAQLDYVNEDLPTFAFEICYYKKGVEKGGWLYDEKKKTDFYALVTAIYDDGDKRYSSCKITLINRKKLQEVLTNRGLNEVALKSFYNTKTHGKINVVGLNARNEGYLFLSTKNKAEKPLNLILKLDWLIQNNIGKRLV